MREPNRPLQRSGGNDRVRESLQNMHVTLRLWLMKELQMFMDSGHILETDPEMLTDTVISLLEGYDFYRCLMRGDERFDELGKFLKESALAILVTEKTR